MGGCVYSCGIHMGTNMRIRYYTPQLILVFWCLHVLHSRYQSLLSLKSEVSQITDVEHCALRRKERTGLLPGTRPDHLPPHASNNRRPSLHYRIQSHSTRRLHRTQRSTPHDFDTYKPAAMASYMYEEVLPHPDRPGEIPCKCCRLDHGLDLPVPKDLTVKQIHTHATSFSHSIFSDWTQLNAILKRFEATIRKRWLKKSAKQRRELLLKVRPTIPLVHRPDFEGFRNQGNARVSRAITCSADAHLTPYINLQDLQQGHNLLLFIHSRGRNTPILFASTDAGKAHLGYGWAEEPEPDGIAMLLSVGVAAQSPRQYGALVPVAKLHPRIGVTHSFDPVYGLLTLEIQQSIYSFLLRCVQHILHDIHPTGYRLMPHAPMPEPLSNLKGVWDTVSTHTIEADYRPPQQLSLSRMRLLIDGRTLAAEDHICSLREDPGYFLEHLKEWREHHFLNGDDTPLNWAVIAGQVFANALDSWQKWTWISMLLGFVRPIHEQLGAAIEGGTRLEEWDEHLWAAVAETIDVIISKPMQNIEIMFPTSSGLRNVMQRPHRFGCCSTESESCIRGAEHGWHIKANSTYAQRRACRIFHILSGLDEDQLALHGLRAVVQEAHYMLEHDTEVSQLIDSWLLTDFFDLAVLVDLQDRIAQFHPFSKSWDAANIAGGELVDHLMKFTQSHSEHAIKAIKWSSFHVKSLGMPNDGRFYYPSEKRRTAVVVRELQSAEAALKKYWTEVESHMEYCGIEFGVLFKLYQASTPSTKDWKEQTFDSPVSHNDSSRNNNDHYDLPTTPPTGTENKKTEIATDERTKRKTHGTAQARFGAVTPPSTPAVDSTIGLRKPIYIPRRTFKVMSALLPSPSTISEAPCEVSWDEFIHALNTLGLVPEKLYGSVWIFKPLPKGEGLVSVERSIQFHEPKSVRRGSKIDLTQVRRFGDRLKRAFGWDGETFA